MSHPNHADFYNSLVRLVSSPFKEQDSQNLILVAVGFWYGDIALLQMFSEMAQDTSFDRNAKKRSLYVLDTLRRYPCASTERKNAAKNIISIHLRFREPPCEPSVAEMVKDFRLDKLAFEWGLTEDISTLMQDVLHYQTRHYASAQNTVTGFNETTIKTTRRGNNND